MEDELKFIRDKLKYSRDFGAFVTEILDLKFESFHNEWIETFERNIGHAKDALRKAASKLPSPCIIKFAS